ncbi:hypothetical protein T4D_8680 [Trichinella pseudospiralis]|uniref:Uncharacterized protein n=1 Tax=Trichinella pseudospiralis TaxID=6337 RepID=A0A0V1G4M2_TRIPS|nr:hypothetical protein T4D_8680 [Trichinella pseudospiralis]
MFHLLLSVLHGKHFNFVPNFILRIIIFYAKQIDLLKHSPAKVERTTLHHKVLGEITMNSRDQGCFEISNQFRRIKLDA